METEGIKSKRSESSRERGGDGAKGLVFERGEWGFEGIERSVMAMEYGPHRDAYQTFCWCSFTEMTLPVWDLLYSFACSRLNLTC